MSDANDEMARILWVIEHGLRAKDPQEYARFLKLSEEEKREYARNNWTKFQVMPNHESLETMNGLLHPLLKNSIQRGATDQIAEELTKGMARKMLNVFEFHMIITRLVENTPGRTPRETIQLYLPSYLMLFEGAYTSEVDMIAHLLTLDGRNYYRKKGGPHMPIAIRTYRQMRAERFRDKLNFLATQGFEAFVAAGDYDLRNAIAHTEYDLTSDGEMRYACTATGKPVTLTLEEMNKKLEDLLQCAAWFQSSGLKFYVNYVKNILSTLPEPVKSSMQKKIGLDLDKI